MPVTINWLLDKHIIDYKLIATVTSAEMLAVTEKVIAMMEANSGHAVHVLYDVSECKRIPYDIPNIVKSLKPFLSLENMGWGVSYGSKDPVTKFTADVIIGLTKTRYRDFKTFEEAMVFLAKVDTILPEVEGFESISQRAKV